MAPGFYRNVTLPESLRHLVSAYVFGLRVDEVVATDDYDDGFIFVRGADLVATAVGWSVVGVYERRLTCPGAWEPMTVAP